MIMRNSKCWKSNRYLLVIKVLKQEALLDSHAVYNSATYLLIYKGWITKLFFILLVRFDIDRA